MRHLLIKIWKNWFKNIRCDWDIHWLKNMNWLLWPDLNWIFQYPSLIKRIAMDCLSISHASLHGTLLVSTAHLWNKITFIKPLVGWHSLIHIYLLGSAWISSLRKTWAPLHILSDKTPTYQLFSTYVKYSFLPFL